MNEYNRESEVRIPGNIGQSLLELSEKLDRIAQSIAELTKRVDTLNKLVEDIDKDMVRKEPEPEVPDVPEF